MKVFGNICAAACLAASAMASSAAVVVTGIAQDGNVFFEATGAYDFTGLDLVFENFNLLLSTQPSSGLLNMGQSAGGAVGVQTDFYGGGISGPSSFGSGGLTNQGIGLGDLFSINRVGGGTAFGIANGASTTGSILTAVGYAGASFESLGLDVGTYEWTWSTDSVKLIIGGDPTTVVPLPAGLPLLASALLGAGVLMRRRTSKA